MTNTAIVQKLLQVSISMLRDIDLLSPTDQSLVEKDISFVKSQAKKFGMEFFTISLPQLCSDFERFLETGVFQTDAPTLKNGFPALLNRYFVLIAEDNASSVPYVVRLIRSFLRLWKKLDFDCTPERIHNAISAFREIESDIPKPRLAWGCDDLYRDFGPGYTGLDLASVASDVISVYEYNGGLRWDGIPEQSDERFLEDDLRSVQRCADRILGGFAWDWTSIVPKHGPGAVAEAIEGGSKYSFPSWPSRLEQCYPRDIYGLINHFDPRSLEPHDESRDPPARLIAVPKDQKGPRLIASEPICNQYVQQGIMKLLRKCVKRSALRDVINFTSQDHNRALALTSSKTGDLSTIDLSSASDRLSCRLVESMFRMNRPLLEALNSCRTPTIENSLGGGWTSISMSKFAAQGSAVTFPVQTIVYAIICVAIASEAGYKESRYGEVLGIYGDDMVVPSSIFGRVCNVLTVLGLKVNRSKSFTSGNFRESCGMDAFRGVEVTPVYIRKIPITHDIPANVVASIVDTAKSLYLEDFHHTYDALTSLLPERIRDKIALLDATSTTFGLPRNVGSKVRFRMSPRYQRLEAHCFAVETKLVRQVPSGLLSLHEWFDSAGRREDNGIVRQEISTGVVREVKSRLRLQWVPITAS
nr:MAG: hypothetical protein 3 [Leviviridae sp.]